MSRKVVDQPGLSTTPSPKERKNGYSTAANASHSVCIGANIRLNWHCILLVIRFLA